MGPAESDGGEADTDGGAADRALPDDVVTDLLADDERRRALAVLAERQRPVTVGDLAATVLARERGTSPSAVGTDERRALREEFYQRHLPKLTATDVVAYDSMLGTVELVDRGSVVEALEEA